LRAGFNDIGVDVQYPWEPTPRRFHEHPMQIKPFFIDKYPVTNAQFKQFLDATHYHPKDDQLSARLEGRKLPDGAGMPSPSPGFRRRMRGPTPLGPESACRTSGSGSMRRKEQTAGCILGATSGTAALCRFPTNRAPCEVPDPVDAHPKGASPFGVMDMVGNVWQWTEEFVDEHTRGGILRGGSYYQPQGSIWYFPQAYKLNTSTGSCC
jgi:iron(II)-dependent oxidoreductase